MIRYKNCLRLAQHIALLHSRRMKAGEPHPILFTGDDFHIDTLSPLIRDLYVSGVIHYGMTKDGRLAFYLTERYHDIPTYYQLCDELEERLEKYT